MSRAYPKRRTRMRKVTGIRKRRKGENRRTTRGDDTRRTKKGIEMAKTATSTTEVMLSVCIIACPAATEAKRHALDVSYSTQVRLPS